MEITLWVPIFFGVLVWLIIFWIILYNIRLDYYRKKLDECDTVIEDMIRIMWRDAYDEFCNYCWWCYYFYKFKSSAKMKDYSKSSWKK